MHSLYSRPIQVTISILNISPIKCHTVKQDTFAYNHATDCTEHYHKANKILYVRAVLLQVLLQKYK